MFSIRSAGTAPTMGLRPAMLAVLAVLTLASAAPLHGQGLRSDLFQKVDRLMAAATEARAEVLAPTNFAEAKRLHERAETKLDNERSLESIRRDLEKAIEHLEKALEVTELAGMALASPLSARDDAEGADAARYAPRLWKQADEKFGQAARALEDGNVDKARSRGGEATALFREAELEAIKTNFFDETQELLKSAKKKFITRYAPDTLERSRELLEEAEAALERDRYDTDLPRTLAGEAKYEANHAFYIADLARMINDDELTIEHLVLESERPLASIADAVDLVPRFDRGQDETARQIVQFIESLQMENETLAQDLADRGRALDELEAQIAALEGELGGASEEHVALQRRLEAEAEIRERFDSIQKMFGREEARVMREDDDVIVRVVGLQFDVGKAVIQPEYFSLLTKVQDAINLFPGSHIQVEGHTDSHGTDEMNMELSQSRADAVREYLIANMRIDRARVSAVGRGETQPIANNETREGRARNRRIDVVITPDLESMVP
ncbi:MAG: OmpA family protein [Candidatus Eisenbacteria bacterium]